MPATPDGAQWGSFDEQREWFWLNFSQELARAKTACATDTERERLDQLRNGVRWLHSAIWQIHSIRPNAQPDDLNLAATELLLQCHRFQWLIPVDDMDRLAAVHEQGFVASLAGVRRESFGLLCIILAEWHIEKLMAHRSDLSPRTPNPKTSHNAYHIHIQEGHCFYSRQDPATGLRVADCSPDDVQAVNAAFALIPDFNFASVISAAPLPKMVEVFEQLVDVQADQFRQLVLLSQHAFPDLWKPLADWLWEGCKGSRPEKCPEYGIALDRLTERFGQLDFDPSRWALRLNPPLQLTRWDDDAAIALGEAIRAERHDEERERRLSAPPSDEPAKPPATPKVEGTPVDDVAETVKRVALMLGEDGGKIMAVVNHLKLSTDQKLHALGALDERFKGYKSPALYELLGVSPGSVTNSPTWRKWHPPKPAKSARK